MSTQNPTHGQKVTDSSAPEIEEGAGAIASDSLAAESTRDGGDFAENRGSEPLGVKGANSTFANENTSGAETLEPSDSKASRTDDESYSTNPEDKRDTEGELDSGAARYDSAADKGGRDVPETEDAPSYVNSQFVDTAGPKGKNLTEGGFDSDDSKNASYAEIGSKEDPSLQAQEKFSKENSGQAVTSGMAGQGGAFEVDAGTGTYDALDGEREA